MPAEEQPRDINSGAPFKRMALKYHQAGYYPLPLPPREKAPPPTGYTGHNNNKWHKVDKDEQVSDWLGDPNMAKGNIGLWVHEGVLGIDVDAYDKATKTYEGGLTLDSLESRLGPLPPSWASTARMDGVSGIRFFQVPKGIVFPGKAGPNIELIYSGYRYAVVYPSYHPEGGQYRWYRPGMNMDGEPARMLRTSLEHPDGWQHKWVRDTKVREFPQVHELTMLPPEWVHELSLGKRTNKPMDIDSNIPELDEWIVDHMSRPRLRKPKWCKRIRDMTALHKKNITDSPDSHPVLINAHWNMIQNGVEGHHGWRSALDEIEKHYKREVITRDKRMPEELRGELFRSYYNAVRLVKGAEDEAAATGGQSKVSTGCACFKEGELGPDSDRPAPTPTGRGKDPSEYRLNDDGNAEHLHDLYGENLMYIAAFDKWMFWNASRWIRDSDGIARRCFWKVRDRQESQVDQLWAYARNLGPDHPEAKQAQKKAVDFSSHAKQSGNNRTAEAALKAATNIEGVTVDSNVLDTNPRLLGVENGVLELKDDGAILRVARHDDYVTHNTGVKYLEPMDIARAGGAVHKGLMLWHDYLDRFLPDLELRTFVQKVMGYCMMGENSERLAIFLYGDTSTGKSVMLKAVMAAMGEYAITVNLNSVFKDRDLNPALAAVLPKRIITASEAGSNNHLHADLFKRITGNDHVSAEIKFSNDIQVRIPAFTPIIATNGAPTIEGADTALKKRLLVIPFNQRISAEDDKKNAGSDIAQLAKEAVFSWLVEGWRLYASQGLDPKNWPAKVKSDTLDFSASLSDMGEFVADMVESDRNSVVSGAEAYDAYLRWASEQRIKESDQYPRRKFAIKMKEAGFPPKVVTIDQKPVRGYHGIRIIEGRLKIKSIVDGR